VTGRELQALHCILPLRCALQLLQCIYERAWHRLPRAIAHKTMLRQRPARIELRKAQRHPTPNRRLAVHQSLRAQVQALAPIPRLPRQHLRAVQGHQHGVLARQCEAQAGLVLVGGGGKAHKGFVI
jgi:hypothetical protein